MHGSDPAELIWRDSHRITRYRLRVHQRLPRDCRKAVRRMHICVANVVVGSVWATASARWRVSSASRLAGVSWITRATWVIVSIVVNVRYVDIRYVSVSDVHSIKVAAAHSVPGKVWLAEPERAPAVAAK